MRNNDTNSTVLMVGALVLLASGVTNIAEATTVLGVTRNLSQNNNGGIPTSIFSVETSTGFLTKIDTAGTDPNSFAWNRGNLYYYGQHIGRELWAYNTDTAMNVQISADLNTDATVGAGDILSGSATYDPASGRYYYNPEDPNTGEAGTEIHWIEFDATGLVIADSGTITPDLSGTTKTSLGNFGDIAVGPDGFLYGASDDLNPTTLPNSLNSFWKLDLSDPNLEISTIGGEFMGATVAPQIAFDENGDLWANFWDTGLMGKVDLATGELSEVVALDNDDVSGDFDFSDMASTWNGDTPPGGGVPEPSTIALTAFGLLSLVIRPRRRR